MVALLTQDEWDVGGAVSYTILYSTARDSLSCGTRISLREPSFARLLRPLRRFIPRFIVRRTRSVTTLTPRNAALGLESFITAAREKGVTLMRNTFFWRRTRDSNSRAALATYSLSRGASSPLE